MQKKWEYIEQTEEKIEEVSKKYNVSKLLAKVILNRNFANDEEILSFLNPDISKLYDPYLIKDMEKAVDRILLAIERKENILIYGDYDVDGITSITVVKKFLNDLGCNAKTYLPNRLDEGYGLNKLAIDEILKMNVSLIITVDCGITAIEEVDYANSKGLEVIITDHHEVGETIPNAIAVVDPKRKESQYPFSQLAGVGVAFKLIQAISIKKGLDKEAYLKYLEIVCIGTIADIVPLIDENRIIAKYGLDLLQNTENLGIKALINKCGISHINSTAISFTISPRINACGRIGNPQIALDLFLSDNEEQAEQLANELNIANLERQTIERNIFEQAKQIIEENNLQKNNIIILGNDTWHHGVIGIVASKIVELYYKPCILICFEDGVGKASGRSVMNFDLHKALNQASDLLLKFGGHEMAVGLTIDKEKFEEFKERMITYTNGLEQPQISKIKVDAKVTSADISLEAIKELKKMEPFGEKNPLPLFVYKNIKIDAIRTLNNDRHIKLNVKDNQVIYDAIGFNLGHLKDNIRCGDRVDILHSLEINKFNQVEKIQLNVKDIMKPV